MNEVRAIHISGYERESRDFYRTPAWVTAALLRHVTLRGPVWEPCCGDGAMATVLADHGHQVVASDIVDRGYGRPGVDFFTCQRFPTGCAAMVTNPPYGEAGPEQQAMGFTRAIMPRFVRHALDLTQQANGQLALLVRLQWSAGKNAANLISSGPLDAMVVLTKRIRWFDMGPKTNNGQHHHCWLFWDYQRNSACPPRIVFAG
ncbi:MAG TPA: hypothetical protein VFN42_05755 [Acetobacteraceae bacterium]|nr:hypothetical protein [Acetobacteraceae bacterium]